MSTSYMGTELIDYLKKPNGEKSGGITTSNKELSSGSDVRNLEQAYSFNHILATGTGGEPSVSQP